MSLRPVPGTVAASLMTTVWSSCSKLFPPSGAFSVYKTALRTGLGTLSVAPEEELKVLDLND